MPAYDLKLHSPYKFHDDKLFIVLVLCGTVVG